MLIWILTTVLDSVSKGGAEKGNGNKDSAAQGPRSIRRRRSWKRGSERGADGVITVPTRCFL